MAVFSYYRYYLPLFIISAFAFLAVISPYALAQDEAPLVVDEYYEGEIKLPKEEELNGFDTDKNSISISAPSAAVAVISDAGEDNFFDANDLVPQSEMGKKGPLKVDPVTQPASKFVVVRKNHHADEKTSQLVSAERAIALGRYDSALLMFDGLYKFNKKDARILMGRAVSLQKIGRFDEAMQMYDDLSKIEPDNIDVKVNMLGLMGTRYPSIALRRLLALHGTNRGNVGLTAQIAIAYAKTGDTASALSYLGMAASIEPDNANHVFNMAIISDRAGDEKQAVSYYEQALEIDTVHGAGRSIPRESVYERLAQIR